MNCKQCGMEIPQDAGFCPNCGIAVAQEASGDQSPIPQQNVGQQAPNQNEFTQNPPSQPYGQTPPQNGFTQAPNLPPYGQVPPQNGIVPPPDPGVYNMPPYGQMPPQPPYNMPNPYVVPGDPGKNGMAVTSMILGIISVACCSGALVLSVLAIIFGILGLKSQKRGMAIAGLVLGIISVLIAVAYIVLMAIGMVDGFFYEFNLNPGLDY